MIDGILLINKEKGITSYDVIRKLKKIFPREQKIGHAGTLDPFAGGLLIVLLGKGTKLMNTIGKLEKKYIVTAEFGYATDTQDSTGKKIFTHSELSKITREKIEEKLTEKFLGEIDQTPPLYSAKKVKGKKAYELAREGKAVVLNPRKIFVKEFNILDYNWPFVKFEIICSSGTYIRTLIDDLGKSLGTFATAVDLDRISIGGYNVKEAFNSKDITMENKELILETVINLEDIQL
ncbi:MAG TPA: tRNA pseudouridine(55) synthase TruB [Candidatus Dojkabacteria bacterium]|nr:tRNA pseudouridine(55) synthase TruB [Candidatus Dojkabacteria bacterium]